MYYKNAVDKFNKYLLVEKGYSRLTIKEYSHDLDLLYRYLIKNYNYNENIKVE
ncbi:MAG: site-specific integrase, partial [bacterium]